MGTQPLEDLVTSAKERGFSVDSHGNLASAELQEALSSASALEVKQAFAPAIDEILATTTQQDSRASMIRSRYLSGERITVEDTTFFDPKKGTSPKPNTVSFPGMNTASNLASRLGTPLSLLGTITKNPLLQAVGKAAGPVAGGVKSLSKTYKESTKDKKDPKRMARFGVTGVGSVLSGLPTTLGDGNLKKFIYTPLVMSHRANQAWQMARSLYKDTVKGDLPDLDAMRTILSEQGDRYRAARSRYLGTSVETVDKDKLEDKLTDLNGFLKHHVHKVSLENIDIEFIYGGAKEPLKGKVDLAHETAEFPSAILGSEDPAFAWSYANEIFMIDGTKNLGRASYRVDRLFEDIATHQPDGGYDLLMEEKRFAAVAHAYVVKLMGSVEKTLKDEEKRTDSRMDRKTRERVVRTAVYNDLLSHGITADELQLVWQHQNPIQRAKDRVLGKVGSGAAGKSMTTDYFKLLRTEGVL